MRIGFAWNAAENGAVASAKLGSSSDAVFEVKSWVKENREFGTIMV